MAGISIQMAGISIWAPFAFLLLIRPAGSATVSGTLSDDLARPIVGGRITLFNSDTSYFRESRTGPAGAYSLTDIPEGAYKVGASSIGSEYKEVTQALPTAGATVDFSLGPETNPGEWEIILATAPDRLGGTNSAVLLPDGRVMYCHNTLDPFIFNPLNNGVTRPPASQRQQGCHAVTVLPNGQVIYVGGHDIGVYGPGTRQVKTFDPVASKWEIRPDLNGARWYPSMVQLADGELLAVGGGNENNPQRSKTSELMDPATLKWTPAGDIALGNEVSPIVLLYTGEVLMTHRPPQLFNPGTKQWRKAGDFVQANRMANGDHADHDMVLMPDGKAVAIGFLSFDMSTPGNFVEIYDPGKDSWKLGAAFAPVRSRPNITLLPGRMVLVMGGKKEEKAAPGDTNAWGQVKLTDLYDPAQDKWRRLAEMKVAREYHATPVLVPDGRVVMVGGEGSPGNEPDKSVLEVFRPPYLFRGVRPVLSNLNRTLAARGESLEFQLSRANAPSQVILMSLSANTHFMESGNNRYLELEFNQSGSKVTAKLPTDTALLPLGFYMLSVLVDGIPSPGIIVKIQKAPTNILPDSRKASRLSKVRTGWMYHQGRVLFEDSESYFPGGFLNLQGRRIIEVPLLP